jgi:hypothetical protein
VGEIHLGDPQEMLIEAALVAINGSTSRGTSSARAAQVLSNDLSVGHHETAVTSASVLASLIGHQAAAAQAIRP